MMTGTRFLLVIKCHWKEQGFFTNTQAHLEEENVVQKSFMKVEKVGPS